MSASGAQTSSIVPESSRTLKSPREFELGFDPDFDSDPVPNSDPQHDHVASRRSRRHPASPGEAGDEEDLGGDSNSSSNSNSGPVTWMSIPRKDQLSILFLCRVVDFLQVASLQAYVFYQLKSLDGSLSDAEVSTQAGLLQGCFTGSQVLTAVLWGKAADASWCGRKMVIMVGLGGTAISCLGYGFATSFFWAAFWRVFGGGINGTVGSM